MRSTLRTKKKGKKNGNIRCIYGKEASQSRVRGLESLRWFESRLSHQHLRDLRGGLNGKGLAKFPKRKKARTCLPRREVLGRSMQSGQGLASAWKGDAQGLGSPSEDAPGSRPHREAERAPGAAGHPTAVSGAPALLFLERRAGDTHPGAERPHSHRTPPQSPSSGPAACIQPPQAAGNLYTSQGLPAAGWKSRRGRLRGGALGPRHLPFALC